MKDMITIRKPSDIVSLLGKWAKKPEENFLTVTLNGHHDVIKVHHITKGILNKTIAHPRECFYPALKDRAAAVVFMHNHSSGTAEPSPEDIDLNNRLLAAGDILGFHVLDHVIMAKRGSWYSLRENGKFDSEHVKVGYSLLVEDR